MSHYVAFILHALSRRARPAFRDDSHAAPGPSRMGDEPDTCREPEPHNATRGDQLERIALYVRAGYFDINHGADTYSWLGGIGPD